MKVRVAEIVQKDLFAYKQGKLAGKEAFGWLVKVECLEGSLPIYVDPNDASAQPVRADGLKFNTMVPNEINLGDEFECSWGGDPHWESQGLNFAKIERKQGTYKRGSGGGAPTSSPPARAPQNGSHGPQQASSKQVPTMAQAVIVLRECMEAVHGWGTEAHATTLFLGRLRGDIRRDPTPAEREAAEAAKAQAAQAAAEEAERAAAAARAAAEAAAQRAPGYATTINDGGNDDIPF